MKHILRKLHIGGSHESLEGRNHEVSSRVLDGRTQILRTDTAAQAEATSPSTSALVPDHRATSGFSGWFARHSASSSSSGPSNARSRPETVERNSEALTSFNFYEEEYQVQLALALSVSNQNDEEDPEILQIRAAKRISLGRPPSPGNTPAEITAHRYWNYNVLDYNEKIMDGFYDVYGGASDFGTVGKFPSLVDLQSTPLTDTVGCEVVLVNRLIDHDLVETEQAALCIAVDCGGGGLSLQHNGLVQKIADLVVHHMGGPVLDANDMLNRWKAKSIELRASLNTIVLPLGCLHIGLSRHRALLFKVLADHVGILCRLVKGSHYTGTDEGAVNIVKLDNGREYIVDLMGAPGTLLPAETVGNTGTFEISLFEEIPSRINNLTQDRTDSSWDRNSSRIADGSGIKVSGADVEHLTDGVILQSSSTPIHDPDINKGIKGELLDTSLKGSAGEELTCTKGSLHSTVEASMVEVESQVGFPKKREVVHKGHHQHYMDYWTKHVSNSFLGNVAEWEIPWEEIIIDERIGLGSYGEVHHGDWRGKEVAVKRFLDQDFSGDAMNEFISEVQIMGRMQHPNVVLFLGAVTQPPNLSIVTEYLSRGSLFRLLHRPNCQLDERRRLQMAIDVAEGMNYLHTSTPIIVHRDLKSPNLLVDRNWVVKVCDFGLSRMKNHTFLSSKSTAGTPEWMAPEVLRNDPSNEKCDVYSFGVILWELATLEQPWSGMNPMQVVGAVGFQNRRLDIPKNIDPAVTRIIGDCWQSDPSMRPPFSELTKILKPLQRLLRE